MNFVLKVDKIFSYQTLVYKNGTNTYKKPAYKKYEKEIYYQLKKIKDFDFTTKYDLSIEIIFKAKNKNIGDLDNITKPILDIISKYYNFDDRNIVELKLKKEFNNNLQKEEINLSFKKV